MSVVGLTSGRQASGRIQLRARGSLTCREPSKEGFAPTPSTTVTCLDAGAQVFFVGPGDSCGSCGTPLHVGWPWPVLAQVLDGERVVDTEHLQARPALARHRLWVLGSQTQGDATSAQRVGVAPRMSKSSGCSAAFVTAGLKNLVPHEPVWF